MTGICKKKSVDHPKSEDVRMSKGQPEIPEVFEVCPYDSSHQIPSDKMAGHICKCRKEYKIRKEEKNEELVVLHCKYNHLHRVQAPEIHYHEERCNDVNPIRSYQLNIKPFLQHYDFEHDLDLYELDKEELKEMYAGFYIDHFIGAESYGVPVSFSEVLDPTRVKPPSGFATAEPPVLKKPTAKSPQPSTSTGSTTPASSGTFATPAASGTSVKEDDVQTAENDEDDCDSEEYWNKESKRPVFSYLDNLSNPKKPLLKFPPNLSKGKRRQFVEWNTKWMEKLLVKQGIQGPSLADEERMRSLTNGKFNLKESVECELTPEEALDLLDY